MYESQKQKTIDKINQNQEADVKRYAWETIPYSLRLFWANWFKEESINEKNVNLQKRKLNPNEK